MKISTYLFLEGNLAVCLIFSIPSSRFTYAENAWIFSEHYVVFRLSNTRFQATFMRRGHRSSPLFLVHLCE